MDLSEVLIRVSLHNAVTQYGIEGTEQKIKELYKLMPQARDKILEAYERIYKQKGKNKK